MSYPGIQILSLGGGQFVFFSQIFFSARPGNIVNCIFFFFAEQKKTKKMAPQAKIFLGTV